MGQVPDEEGTGDPEEPEPGDRRGPLEQVGPPPEDTGEDQDQRNEVDAGGDRLGPRVKADAPVPRSLVRDVVGHHRGGAAVVPCSRVTRDDLLRTVLDLAPHVGVALGPARGQGIERRLRGTRIEDLRLRLLVGATNRYRATVDDLGDPRVRVVHVADDDRPDRTNHRARRFEPDLEAMAAEVALLSGVILRVDEDRVVRARRDARLAADADRLVEVDEPVGALIHRRGRARRDARGVLAHIAAGDLERPARLREEADVHRFHVRTGHADGDLVLGLTCSRARMAADAQGLIEHLRPLRRASIRSGQTPATELARLEHWWRLHVLVGELPQHAR